MGFRITSWNVNGIRNPFQFPPWREKRTFQAMFDILEADIVIMQETKIQRKDLRDDMVLVPGWDVHFSLPKQKNGYSGVAIYTRTETCCPIRSEEGITGVLYAPGTQTRYRERPAHLQIGGYPRPGQRQSFLDESELDSEGRCVILEFPAFVLIGVYSPANRDSTRDEFRISFLEAVDIRVRNLVAAGKQVVLAGDINVIRAVADVANIMEYLRKEGLTVDDFMAMPARRIINQLVFDGEVRGGERDEGREEPVLHDLCRSYHPTREGMFTCWDTKRNTRPANNGSRIDYVFGSAGIKSWFTDANIQEGLMGSDHCPVFAVLLDVVLEEERMTSLLDLMNPVGMFKDGKRLRDWSQKDLLPTSARLIPEFDGRRNIREMFLKKSPKKDSSKAPDFMGKNDSEEIEPGASSQGDGFEPSRTVSSAESEIQDTESQFGTEETSAANVVEEKEKPRQPSAAKRQPQTTSQPAARPQKKSKLGNDKISSPRGPGGKAQSTLMGFFKPTAPADTRPSSTFNITEPAPSASPSSTSTSEISLGGMVDDRARDLYLAERTRHEAAGAPLSALEEAESVFDPIEAKASWSKILGKRIAPKCEHGEPCKILVTKKAGVNCGRSFYICPRPLGPSGEKERGTEWRCGTFIWSSDWNGSQT